MPRLFRRLGAACVALVLVAIACRDRTLSGPGLPRHAGIAIVPRFQVGAESAEPISRIHAVVRRVDDEGTPLDEEPLVDQTDSVDPEDTSWPVTLDFSISAPVRVIVELELIYIGIDEPISTEWAARVGPITVTPGVTRRVEDVDLGRGPLPNLEVTSVAIGEFPSTLLLGSQFTFNATVEPDISGTVLFWGTLDPSIATIDRETGNVTLLATGTARITATAGFESDTITINVVDPSTIVSFLSVESGQDQTAAVNTAVAQPIRVRAYDNGENPIPGVSLQFSVLSGGGSIIGPTTLVTDANGNVQLGGWTLGTAAGLNELRVIAVGTDISSSLRATAVAGPTFDIVVVSGNNQSGNAGQPLAQPLVARVRDQFGNPVAGQRVNFATANGGTFSALADTSDAQGLVQVTWTPGFDGTSQIAVADIGTSAAQFTANVTLPPPAVQLALASADKVTLGRSQVVNVSLPTPAPAGGASITVTSSAPGVLAVNGGGTLTIPAGQTQGTVGVTGVTEGNATLTATSPQYQNGTLATSVELRVLGLPTTINVPYGQTASLPINIPRPAPAGGITISLSTSDPTRVGLAAITAVIPAGAVTGFVTLNGVLPGPSTIIASHPLYVPDTTAATTTAALDIVNSSYNLNTSFGTPAVIRFTSNNVAVPAPAPGIPVTLTAVDPACLTVPANATITTGLTDVTVQLTAGPGQVFPCTTRLRVTTSTSGVAADSVNVTVSAQPGISVTSTPVGRGLQRIFSASFNASNHGGTTVRITSPNAARLLVAPDATTPGSAFIDLPLAIGGTQVNFYVQVLDTTSAGAIPVTVTAPGFATGTGTVTVQQAALDVSGVNTNTTSLSGDDPFTVRIGVANAQGQFLTELQDRRAGGTPLVATATVSDTNVMKLVTSASATVSGTAQIVAGQSNTPTTVASGGFALRPIGNGTATVSATIPGVISTTSNSTVSVTVTTPNITAGAVSVGSGLQRFTSLSLGAPAPAGGTTVRITSPDPTTLLVSPNTTTAGTAFIDVAVPAGGSSANFYVQGLEGRTGSPAVTLDAPGYASGRTTMPVLPAALDLSGVNPTTTTLSNDDPINVRIGIANGQLQFLTELQDVRAGGQPVTVTFVSDTPSVASLVTTAGIAGTRTAVIGIGQSSTPGSVASGGVAIRPLSAGVTRISASAPGIVSTSNNSAFTVTVSQPTQTVNVITVGSGLQRFNSGSLGAPAPAGTIVRLTSADPSRLRLSPNATTAGTASIDIPLTTGSQSYNFYVQGMEGQTGTVAVTATTPLFANATANIPVVQSYLDLSGVNTSTTTLSVNDDITGRVGIANAGGQFLTELQDVRAGGTPISITFATSVPGVAQLVPSSTNGSTATSTIAVGQSNTPSTVGSGGVQLDPLTAGTTVVTMTATQGQLTIPVTSTNGSATVTVSAPTLTVQSVTVGAGLQRFSTVSFGAPAPAGGMVVRLTSSQQDRRLLSPNATTAGTGTLDVTVPAGSFSLNFYTQGVEGQTGTPTVSATAPGFADGTATEPVVKPALDISGITTSPLASAADDPFTVRIGIANVANQFLTELQDVRAGASPLTVTVTNSNATAGQLATSSTRAQSVTATIPVGQSSTPSSVATGGVAFDPLAAGSTSVTATIPGYTTTINNGTVVVNVQAGLVQAAARSLVGTR